MALRPALYRPSVSRSPYVARCLEVFAMTTKRMTEDFTAWIDSLDKDYELTVEQVILMSEAWNAAMELAFTRQLAEAILSKRSSS